MLVFKYAEELKKTYQCFGHFYNLNINNKLFPSRSVLEIVNYDFLKKHSLDTLSILPAELLVIMMNPGSSRPLEFCEIKNLTFSDNLKVFPKDLVLTQPDNTQYQIMRLMDAKGINHIRVINILDLRETKSLNLKALLNATNDSCASYSIFSGIRDSEYNFYLNNLKSKNVLLAWGKQQALTHLYKLCLTRLPSGINKIGVASGSYYYAHPSPMNQKHKIRWLNEISNFNF